MSPILTDKPEIIGATSAPRALHALDAGVSRSIPGHEAVSP
jgi:hypothetical protein